MIRVSTLPDGSREFRVTLPKDADSGYFTALIQSANGDTISILVPRGLPDPAPFLNLLRTQPRDLGKEIKIRFQETDVEVKPIPP
jgi:hypothetical protein